MKSLSLALLAVTLLASIPLTHAVEAPAQDTPPIEVRTFRDGDMLIEERVHRGQVYEVKVTPDKGKAYNLRRADGQEGHNSENGQRQLRLPSWTLRSW